MTRTVTLVMGPRQEALRPWHPVVRATRLRDRAVLLEVRQPDRRPPAILALRRQGGTRRPADSPLTIWSKMGEAHTQAAHPRQRLDAQLSVG